FYLEQRIEKVVLGLGSRIQVGRATIALEPDDADLKTTVDYPAQNYGRILGRSATMKQLFARMVRLEGSLVPVLVEGESGVGKELVANALHDRSKVGAGPFVAVNCGALARELILSELFGHKKGAFTGAQEARKGAFEIADGGTLFLDEIGELPLDVQPVLLRALETSEIRPVGSETTKKIQVRIVAATNRDLAAEVQAGRFRQDLFYRLAVVRLSIPPLRSRLDDVPLLATEFARSAGIGDLDASMIEKLKARPLAGNVRELRNLILAFSALGELPAPGELRADLLEGALVELVDLHQSYAAQKDALVDVFTRIYLRTLLAHTSGNQTLAAKLAELDRGYLGKLIAKYDLFRQ
ncbi:MAG: sigma-54 dependent transcriptional regulator, partial [Polyangiaceae bacterium]